MILIIKTLFSKDQNLATKSVKNGNNKETNVNNVITNEHNDSSSSSSSSSNNNNKNASRETTPNYSNYYKKINSNNLTVPQAISSLNINHATVLTSSTSTSQISNESLVNTSSRAKHQRKSESDITNNLVGIQKQQSSQNTNSSPVHYPPSIPNNINYNVSPSKTPQITVKTNKSLFKINLRKNNFLRFQFVFQNQTVKCRHHHQIGKILRVTYTVNII